MTGVEFGEMGTLITETVWVLMLITLIVFQPFRTLRQRSNRNESAG